MQNAVRCLDGVSASLLCAVMPLCRSHAILTDDRSVAAVPLLLPPCTWTMRRCAMPHRHMHARDSFHCDARPIPRADAVPSGFGYPELGYHTPCRMLLHNDQQRLQVIYPPAYIAAVHGSEYQSVRFGRAGRHAHFIEAHSGVVAARRRLAAPVTPHDLQLQSSCVPAHCIDTSSPQRCAPSCRRRWCCPAGGRRH